MGADDFLVKALTPREPVARVRLQSRPPEPRPRYRSTGAPLRCNVVLRQADGASGTIVEIIGALGSTGSSGVTAVATEAGERLRRVLDVVVAS